MSGYPGTQHPKFAPGDRVKVRRGLPPGHIRTPRYVQGKIGVVERICGSFPNPEELAHNRHGLPAQPLYRVRFMQKDLWPDYAGPEKDNLELELYQHWLSSPEDK